MKKLILLITWMGFSLTTMALENYQKGYIVMVNGDTVRGFVDNQRWFNSPSRINFKKTLADKANEYTIQDVKLFYLEPEKTVFQAFDISFNTQQRKSSTIHLVDSRTLPFSGFMTVVVSGKMNLYQMDFDDVDYFFVKVGDNPIVQLEIKKQIKAVEQQGATPAKLYGGFLMVYKQTLKNLTTECEASQKAVESLPYDEKNLSAFVQNYNACSTGSNYVKPYAGNYFFRVGVFAGASKSNMSLPEQLYGSKSLASVAPQAGVYFIAYRKKGLGRWGWYNELGVRSISGATFEADYYVGAFRYISTCTPKILHIKFNTAARLSNTKGRNVNFVQAGIFQSYTLSGIDVSYERQSNTFPDKGSGNSAIENKGVFAGAGICIKRFELEARMEQSFGIFKRPDVNWTNLCVLLKYRFGNNNL